MYTHKFLHNYNSQQTQFAQIFIPNAESCNIWKVTNPLSNFTTDVLSFLCFMYVYIFSLTHLHIHCSMKRIKTSFLEVTP